MFQEEDNVDRKKFASEFKRRKKARQERKNKARKAKKILREG